MSDNSIFTSSKKLPDNTEWSAKITADDGYIEGRLNKDNGVLTDNTSVYATNAIDKKCYILADQYEHQWIGVQINNNETIYSNESISADTGDEYKVVVISEIGYTCGKIKFNDSLYETVNGIIYNDMHLSLDNEAVPIMCKVTLPATTNQTIKFYSLYTIQESSSESKTFEVPYDTEYSIEITSKYGYSKGTSNHNEKEMYSLNIGNKLLEKSDDYTSFTLNITCTDATSWGKCKLHLPSMNHESVQIISNGVTYSGEVVELDYLSEYEIEIIPEDNTYVPGRLINPTIIGGYNIPTNKKFILESDIIITITPAHKIEDGVIYTQYTDNIGTHNQPLSDYVDSNWYINEPYLVANLDNDNKEELLYLSFDGTTNSGFTDIDDENSYSYKNDKIGESPTLVNRYLITINNTDPHQTITVKYRGNDYTSSFYVAESAAIYCSVTSSDEDLYKAGSLNYTWIDNINQDYTISATSAKVYNWYNIKLLNTHPDEQVLTVTYNDTLYTCDNYTNSFSTTDSIAFKAKEGSNISVEILSTDKTKYLQGSVYVNGSLTDDELYKLAHIDSPLTIEAGDPIPVNYLLTIIQSDNQTITVTANGVDYKHSTYLPYGTKYTVSITPDEGYTAGTLNKTSGTITTSDSDNTISASEAIPIDYLLTITQSDNQTITVTCNGVDYTESVYLPYKTTYTVSITPDEGYTAGTLNKTSGTIPINGDSISASEAIPIDYLLTITQSDNQTITVTANGVDYTESVKLPYKTAYTVSITPDEGYTAGTLNKTSGIIPINGDTISASEATINSYLLTITQSDNQTITVTANGVDYTESVYLPYKTEYTVSITPDEGYSAGILNKTSGTIGIDDGENIIFASEAQLYTLLKIIASYLHQTICLVVTDSDGAKTYYYNSSAYAKIGSTYYAYISSIEDGYKKGKINSWAGTVASAGEVIDLPIDDPIPIDYLLTIVQSEHQTITVTCNGVDYTESVYLPYKTTYTVSITPDEGYTAGTLNKTSGTIPINGDSISASEAIPIDYLLTIVQSEHQTITVTCNGVDYTESVYLPYKTAYTVSITPDEGYTAGTLNKTSGTIPINGDSISASEATINSYLITINNTDPHQTITVTANGVDYTFDVKLPYGTAYTVSVIGSISDDNWIQYKPGVLSVPLSGTVPANHHTTIYASAATPLYLLKITQSDNQTITVTANGVEYNSDVYLEYGTEYTVTVKANEGYFAGELNITSGTVDKSKKEITVTDAIKAYLLTITQYTPSANIVVTANGKQYTESVYLPYGTKWTATCDEESYEDYNGITDGVKYTNTLNKTSGTMTNSGDTLTVSRTTKYYKVEIIQTAHQTITVYTGNYSTKLSYSNYFWYTYYANMQAKVVADEGYTVGNLIVNSTDKSSTTWSVGYPSMAYQITATEAIPNNYLLTITQSDYQTITVTANGVDYTSDVELPYGTAYTVSIKANDDMPEGYTVGTLNKLSGTVGIDDSDNTISATSANIKYTLTINQPEDGNQIITVAHNGVDYTDKVELTYDSPYTITTQATNSPYAVNEVSTIVNDINYTLHITQSDYQSITVTANNTEYTSDVELPYGTAYTVSIKANDDMPEGYTVGTLNKLSGTVGIDDSDNTISASEVIPIDYLLTITQSDNQTITVTANSKKYTESVYLPYGTKYTVSITPDEGYTAGTLNKTSGTIPINGDTISASEATIKILSISAVSTQFAVVANNTEYSFKDGNVYLPYGTNITIYCPDGCVTYTDCDGITNGSRSVSVVIRVGSLDYIIDYEGAVNNIPYTGILTEDINYLGFYNFAVEYLYEIIQSAHQTIEVSYYYGNTTVGGTRVKYTSSFYYNKNCEVDVRVVADEGYTAGEATFKRVDTGDEVTTVTPANVLHAYRITATEATVNNYTLHITQSDYQTITVTANNTEYTSDVELPYGTAYTVSIKANDDMPEGYTVGTLNKLSGTVGIDDSDNTISASEAGIKCTLTINQPEDGNQAITVTYNGVDYTDKVELTYGSPYTITTQATNSPYAVNEVNLDITELKMYLLTITQSDNQTITVTANSKKYTESVYLPYKNVYTVNITPDEGYTAGTLNKLSGTITTSDSDNTISASEATINSYLLTITQYTPSANIVVTANGKQYTESVYLPYGTKWTATCDEESYEDYDDITDGVKYTNTLNKTSGTMTTNGDTLTVSRTTYYKVEIIQTAHQTIAWFTSSSKTIEPGYYKANTYYLAFTDVSITPDEGYTAGSIKYSYNGTDWYDISHASEYVSAVQITATEATVNNYTLHITQSDYQTITVTANNTEYTSDVELPYGTAYTVSIKANDDMPEGYTVGTLNKLSGTITTSDIDNTISATSANIKYTLTINQPEDGNQTITVTYNGVDYTDKVELTYDSPYTITTQATNSPYAVNEVNLDITEPDLYLLTIVQSEHQVITVTANGKQYTESVKLPYKTAYTVSITPDEGYTVGTLNKTSGTITTSDSDNTISASEATINSYLLTITQYTPSANIVVTANGKTYTESVYLPYGTKWTATCDEESYEDYNGITDGVKYTNTLNKSKGTMTNSGDTLTVSRTTKYYKVEIIQTAHQTIAWFTSSSKTTEIEPGYYKSSTYYLASNRVSITPDEGYTAGSIKYRYNGNDDWYDISHASEYVSAVQITATEATVNNYTLHITQSDYQTITVTANNTEYTSDVELPYGTAYTVSIKANDDMPEGYTVGTLNKLSGTITTSDIDNTISASEAGIKYTLTINQPEDGNQTITVTHNGIDYTDKVEITYGSSYTITTQATNSPYAVNEVNLDITEVKTS